MSQRDTFIYVLKDPRSGEVRYVGKTVQKLSKRLSFHITAAKSGKNHKSCWIRNVLSFELIPIIELIEIVPGSDGWEDREKYWISYYNIGRRLTNMTAGGDGITSYKHTDESKRKIGEAAKRKNYSEEYRYKLSLSQVGEKNSSNKLTNEDICKIQEVLLKKSKTQKEIAIEFGVDQSHISRIKTGAYLKRCKYNSIYGEV